MDKFAKLIQISKGFENRFREDNPFEKMNNIIEETGELASEINHFECKGVKVQKHGAPDKRKLAKEILDVLHNVIGIANHYNVINELEESIDDYYKRLTEDGYIKTRD